MISHFAGWNSDAERGIARCHLLSRVCSRRIESADGGPCEVSERNEEGLEGGGDGVSEMVNQRKERNRTNLGIFNVTGQVSQSEVETFENGLASCVQI